LTSTAGKLWRLAKASIVISMKYPLGGKEVWWGSKIRVKFKKDAAGMAALWLLASAVESETSGFTTGRASKMGIDLTITSGPWSETMAISQRDEYVVGITPDFNSAAGKWFDDEILPALEEFEVQ